MEGAAACIEIDKKFGMRTCMLQPSDSCSAEQADLVGASMMLSCAKGGAG